jgi:hypothetical protein
MHHHQAKWANHILGGSFRTYSFLMLLVDYWSVYNDNTILESVRPEEKLHEILTIPPPTTGQGIFPSLETFISVRVGHNI